MYTLAAASDTVRIWDVNIPGSPNESLTETPCRPRALLPLLKTQPVQTCWSGSFDSLATAYSESIHIHDKNGDLMEVIEPPSLKPEQVNLQDIGVSMKR
jgi:hypothetical protein